MKLSGNFIDDSPHVTYKKKGEDIDVVCVPDKDGIVFITLNEKFPADSVRAGRTEACCRIPHPGSGHEYILLGVLDILRWPGLGGGGYGVY